MTERDRQQRERFVRITNFAAAHSDNFPAGKPASTHVTELQDAVKKFDELSGSQDQSEGAGRAATTTKRSLIAAVREDLEEGIRAVEKLDAYAQNIYRADRVLLGAWKSASHLELKRVKPHAD
jgi:hypothetical protein